MLWHLDNNFFFFVHFDSPCQCQWLRVFSFHSSRTLLRTLLYVCRHSMFDYLHLTHRLFCISTFFYTFHSGRKWTFSIELKYSNYAYSLNFDAMTMREWISVFFSFHFNVIIYGAKRYSIKLFKLNSWKKIYMHESKHLIEVNVMPAQFIFIEHYSMSHVRQTKIRWFKIHPKIGNWHLVNHAVFLSLSSYLWNENQNKLVNYVIAIIHTDWIG